jgi:DNA-binding response OmpR family regulator
MTSPLALIFYENLLMGNQLINRLSDLGYRAKAISDVGQFPILVAAEKPIVVVVELGALAERVCGAIRTLRANPATEHVPVLALFASTSKRADRKLAESAQAAGVTLLARDQAFLGQLPQLLQQVLDVQ